MKQESRKPSVPFEGILYAEVSAWITLAGMVIAVVGLIIGFLYGGGVINEPGMMRDLFLGRGEESIWRRDSVFASMPEQYWFFRHRMDGDELSMIGLVIACYGGVIGVWGMLLSMFRKKEILLYKKGLYTILAAILAAVMTLAAGGLVSPR